MADTVYYDEDTGQYLSEQEFSARQNEYEVVDQVYQEDQPFYVDLVSAGEEFVQDFLGGIGETAAVGLDALGFEEEAELQRQGAEAFRRGSQKNKLERGDDANSFLLGTVPSAAAQIGTLIAAPYTLPLQAVSTAGNKYRQVIDAGDTEETALAAAGVAGVTDTAANLLALKYIPGATKGLKSIVQSGLIESGEEAFTEAVDIGSDFVTAVPDPTLPEIGTRLAHAAGAGAIGGAGVQGISNVVTPQQQIDSDVEVSFSDPDPVEELLALPEAPSTQNQLILPDGSPVFDPNTKTFEDVYTNAVQHSFNEYRDSKLKQESETRINDYLSKGYSKQAISLLQNAQDLALNPYSLQNIYANKPNVQVKDYTDYLSSVKPEVQDIQNFIDTQPYIVDKADVDNHMYQIAKTATEVIVPEGRVSPVIKNDGDLEDVGNLDLQIDTTDSHTALLVKDAQQSQLGAVVLKDDGSPTARYNKGHGYLNDFEQRGKPIWKEKAQQFWDDNVSVQEIRRRLVVDGYKGAADALEAGQDTIHQQIGFTTDALDRGADFFALSDDSVDAVASAIINMRIDKQANPNKDYSNIEEVFRNAQVTDKKTGKTRKFTEEEIKGAVALRESTNGLLKNVLDTERFVKEDSIYNSTDAAIKAAKQLVRQKKLSDNTYRLFVEKMIGLREKAVARVNSSLDKAYDKLTVNPYFPLTRFGDYLVGVTDSNGDLLEYHAADSSSEQQKLLKRLDQKYKKEDKTVSLFADTRKRDYNTSNPYHNVPTHILRSIAEAEQEANFQVLLGQTIQDIESIQLDNETDLDVIKESFTADINKSLSEAAEYFAENLSVAANRDKLGFSARFVEPNFTPGWSKDFRRSINKYIYDGTRYAAEKKSHSKLVREASKLPKGDPAKYYLQKYTDKAFRSAPDPKWVSNWKSITYYYYLGFGYIKSPISNIVGGGMMLGPMLELQIQDAAGKKGVLNHLRKASSDTAQYTANSKAFKEKLLKSDPDALKVLDELERTGVLTNSYYQQFINDSMTPTGKGNTVLNMVKKSDVFFRGSEFLLRSQTAFSSLRASKGKSFEERLKLVKDLNREVAGDFSRFNRPLITHNNVAKLGLMFRNWQFQYLSNLSRMVKRLPKDQGKTLGMYLGTATMVTGLFESVPFLDDAMEVFQKLFPITYGELEEWAGKTAMDVFHYGAIAASLGEKAPQVASSGGGARMLPRAENEYELAGKLVLGAPGSMITKFKYGYDQWALGNTYKAVETIAPQSIKKVMGAVRQQGLVPGERAGLRDHKGNTFYKQDGSGPVMPTGFDSMLNAIGLPNIEQSNAYLRYYTAKNIGEAYTDIRLNRRFANAYARQDTKEVERLTQELEEYNRNLPPARQKKPNMTTIKKMIRELEEDKVLNLTGVRKDLKRSIFEQVTK